MINLEWNSLYLIIIYLLYEHVLGNNFVEPHIITNVDVWW